MFECRAAYMVAFPLWQLIWLRKQPLLKTTLSAKIPPCQQSPTRAALTERKRSPMLRKVLDFVLFGLQGWFAILLELSDWVKRRKNKRADDVEES